jgi:hypothetical protein
MISARPDLFLLPRTVYRGTCPRTRTMHAWRGRTATVAAPTIRGSPGQSGALANSVPCGTSSAGSKVCRLLSGNWRACRSCAGSVNQATSRHEAMTTTKRESPLQAISRVYGPNTGGCSFAYCAQRNLPLDTLPHGISTKNHRVGDVTLDVALLRRHHRPSLRVS